MLSVITQSDAEYTAAIAIDGKRDSIAMRTISILGIVFLPGTFVATLFSIGMFTWGGAGGEQPSSLAASPSIWIYWAVAVPLTVITFLAWILWSKRENQKSNKRLMFSRMRASEAESTTSMTRMEGLVPSDKMA
jgi:O-antigen/teichoic acid export membrane protein